MDNLGSFGELASEFSTKTGFTALIGAIWGESEFILGRFADSERIEVHVVIGNLP